ncbi:transcriptional regulator [Streptomyces olivaceus]|uniref:helix-turn-helix domain-containing protein n=1 Tax=Streptomyces olivaceus TaxID=47716 RepID=UPI0022EDEF89|nr:helix-turn-helix transcriptional regulator [Streptomyces olivaceus]GHI98156.1 transcriptional regulator [Streptomyces olivaceus]
MARERSGRTAQHLVLAARLRTLRESAGLSVKQAADALGAHPATVRRIEQAQTSLDAGQVSTLLAAYGAAPGETEAVLGQLAAANLPGWWHPWRDAMDPWQLDLMSVESATSLIRTWDPALVPLLLRTPAYARAVEDALRRDLSPVVRERRTQLLAERQQQLAKQQTRIWSLIPADVLRTRVGTPETMAEQAEALRAAADRTDVTVQVHPQGAPPHPLTGVPALTFYRLVGDEIPDHVVREGGLPGTADVWDAPSTVTSYRMLLDRSCAMAPHPTKTREVLV